MTTVKVQACGCIALPAEIVEQTSLYPGSILDVVLAPDGKTIRLIPLTTTVPSKSSEGAACDLIQGE